MPTGIYDRTIGRIKICGVYAILNTITGETYIGSSKDIIRRFDIHINSMRRNAHQSSNLQSVFYEYGDENLTLVILEECNIRNLLILETFWLIEIQPEYNTLLFAGRKHYHSKGWKHTEESKQNMSLAKIGNRNAVGNKNHLGIQHTQLTKELISQKNKLAWARRKAIS